MKVMERFEIVTYLNDKNSVKFIKIKIQNFRTWVGHTGE